MSFAFALFLFFNLYAVQINGSVTVYGWQLRVCQLQATSTEKPLNLLYKSL